MEELAPDGRPMILVETRAGLRKWLAQNHAAPTGIWLVTHRKQTGKPHPSYDDIVEELLRYGWIDSKASRLDDERAMIWVAPRKPRSIWARSNKERVERLVAAGLMTPAGQSVIDRAKSNGSWESLDEVEAGVVPPDLAAAFGRYPGSAFQWEGFSLSARRAILWWIVQARRPDTRAVRVEEAARRAAAGEKANQPKPAP